VVTRNCGLAATLFKDASTQEGHALVREPGFLLNKTVRELVQMAYSESILEAAIGMATINSLLEIDEDRCIELNAYNLIAEKGCGQRVAIVGHFPFIPKLQQQVKELWVIEKNPQDDDFTEGEAENLIPHADVVGITGTAFTNHTIEHLLELCCPEAYVVVLGDTTPLSPILFDYGIDALSGTKVIDAELAMCCVSQGATFRQIQGVRRLTMKRDRS
jgi:uncharacterized protein (DUF4213/DUF364 family)